MLVQREMGGVGIEQLVQTRWPILEQQGHRGKRLVTRGIDAGLVVLTVEKDGFVDHRAQYPAAERTAGSKLRGVVAGPQETIVDRVERKPAVPENAVRYEE